MTSPAAVQVRASGRARSRLFAAAALALAGTTSIACGGGPSAQAPGRAKLTGVLRFYPLAKDWQWAFLIHDAIQGGPGLLAVTKVTAFDGHVALLTTGKELTELRVEKDGIVRVGSGAYLLRWPLAAGDRWPGANGATVEVTKVDASMTVEAGTFAGCVETTETFRGDDARTVQTTFCPDVGPVRLDVRETASAPGEVPASAVATLRSFGPTLDLGAK